MNELQNKIRNTTSINFVNPMSNTLTAINNLSTYVTMLDDHKKEMRLKAASKGIAYSTLLTDIPLYSIIDKDQPEYNTFLSEDDSMIFTYVNDKVQNVYKNDYVAKQFELMKTNDISLFIPFLIILSEKLSRIIIRKEDDILEYKIIKDDLFENLSRFKDNDTEINHQSLLELTQIYTQTYNDIIKNQLFAHENKYKKTTQNNYNRHNIMHAKSDFDVFTDQRSFNLIAIILFLVEIINVNNVINYLNPAN